MRVRDRDSILVGRHFEGQVLIGVIFPIDGFPLDVLGKVTRIVILFKAVVLCGLLLARDEGRLILL